MAKFANRSLIWGAFWSLLSIHLSVQPVRADEPPKPDAAKTAQADGQAQKLDGTWILEQAKLGKDRSMIGIGWKSTIAIEKGKFTVSHFYQSKKSFQGTFTLDPKSKAIDLATEKFDFADLGMPAIFPVTQLKGLYELQDGRLTICFRAEGNSPRPVSFAAPEKDERFLCLVMQRAPASFKNLPQKVALRIVDPAGKPVPGVKVTSLMHQMEKPGQPKDRESWDLGEAKVSNEKGEIELSYEQLNGQGIVAWHKESAMIAVADVSPWSLTKDAITKDGTKGAAITTVTLQPECRTSVKVSCPELTTDGGKDEIFHTYVQNRAGQAFQLAYDKNGNFRYPLPPGDYTLMVYGHLFKRKMVPFSVPAGKKEYDVPEIVVEASKRPGLIGKAAPGLQAATGWKGEPVDLASLKGKVVLLEFWGYWCGPCVHSMPVLFALHDRFKDKDLVIVGIHIDIEGDVPDAATLEKKIAKFRKEIWKDRDIPFSVGLFNGVKTEKESERGAIAYVYGIQQYPTSLLIDRAGKVVGEFHARDEEAAIKAMEKVLSDAKK